MRHIVTLSYDGSAFCGWQIQPESPSVQEELQKALSKLLRRDVSVTGAGRTDTGVNAVNYVMHFDTEEGETLPEAALFAYKLNAILPPEIAIHSIVPAPVVEHPADGSIVQDWHARFSATSRTYKYFIHFCKDPFISRWSWWCRQRLDIGKMNEACAHLLGEHDFSCFEKTGGNNATSLCNVTEARWEAYTPSEVEQLGFPRPEEGTYIVFTISANRFLRNMVRAIVGTMVEVGRGKKDPEWVGELVASGTRSDAGESVPGHALFLTSVRY